MQNRDVEASTAPISLGKFLLLHPYLSTSPLLSYFSSKDIRNLRVACCEICVALFERKIFHLMISRI